MLQQTRTVCCWAQRSPVPLIPVNPMQPVPFDAIEQNDSKSEKLSHQSKESNVNLERAMMGDLGGVAESLAAGSAQQKLQTLCLLVCLRCTSFGSTCSSLCCGQPWRDGLLAGRRRSISTSASADCTKLGRGSLLHCPLAQPLICSEKKPHTGAHHQHGMERLDKFVHSGLVQQLQPVELCFEV